MRTPIQTGDSRLRELPTNAAPILQTELQWRETLKRCSAATLAAAGEFRKTGRPEYISTIIIGIIERYVESDLRWKLQSPRADLRLIEDLNVDSLTMMEIVLLVEEVLPISINNEDLRFLRTLGEVQQFAESKVRVLSIPEQFPDSWKDEIRTE